MSNRADGTGSAPGAERKRSEIEDRYKWKLEDIYASDELWEKDYTALDELFKKIPKIKKTLADDEESLAKAMKKMEKMEHIAANLFVYARMRRDEDNGNAKYQAMTARAMDINVRLSSALSFVNPKLLSLKNGKLEDFAARARKKGSPLHDYSFSLSELLRSKKHVLSAKEERLLSMTGDIAGAAKDIFTMLNNADLTFGSVEDENGNDVPLTHGSYIVMMQNEDRGVRKSAYHTFYESYKKNINTIGTAYSMSVKKDIFYAKARNYGSALEKALFSDNVPVSLYDNLLGMIHANLPTMHEYVDMRKKVLSVDELYMYDIYAPLVKDAQAEYSYEKAMEMVKSGLTSLGPDYAELLSRAQKERWIDVYETPGKTSGAYSWGTYGVHPYVLLNHRGDLDSVFTIAHELGHAMHTHFSNGTQPESKAGYTIFVAEVASTVNEILLTHYLLETEQDKTLRKYILNHYLDQFRTTVVRQTMFAEFEKMTHASAESGQPLTYESLCEMYGDLNARYHGPSMQRDDTIIYEWARIPHFYNAFYVYKYATGFSCAVSIAKDILSGKKDAVKNYIRFLSSGGSDHPLELLKIAGVDLASGKPVATCMEEFKSALAGFEKTL
ncbi:MAG: oligoendopeptidase F [Christensenellaceae bacterium]